MSAPAGPTLGAELTRKTIHLCTALLPIAWAQGQLSTVQVRAALSVAVPVALAVEFARHRRGAFGAWFDRRLGSLLRERERSGISGATWLALGMCAVVWLAPREAAIAALWAAAVGDAAAAIVGRSLQRVRKQPADRKSLVGSAGAAVATALGLLWLTTATPMVAVSLGVAAAAAERPARLGDDNVRVAVVVAAAAMLLGLR